MSEDKLSKILQKLESPKENPSEEDFKEAMEHVNQALSYISKHSIKLKTSDAALIVLITLQWLETDPNVNKDELRSDLKNMLKDGEYLDKKKEVEKFYV